MRLPSPTLVEPKTQVRSAPASASDRDPCGDVPESQGFLQERQPLGGQPADLLDVLARIAIAGPATASLRAMLRVATPESLEDRLGFLAGAARAGLGFRTLFNQPLAISTLNHVFKSGPYWAKGLKYAQAGNLQAVMDEYVHVLNESLGLMGG